MDSHYCRLEDIFADWPVMAVRLVYEVSSSYDIKKLVKQSISIKWQCYKVLEFR